MTARLTVLRLGHRGDGVAQGPDGLVYVAGGLPGEEVEGTCIGDRMPSPKILVPSADRIRPPCPHYRTCGGCAVQHQRDSATEAWKIGIVRRALSDHGLDAPIRGFHPSPRQSRRRASLSGRRTKSGAILGFHGKASDQIVDTPHCDILVPALQEVRPSLADLVGLGATRKDEITLQISALEEGVDTVVRGAKPLSPQLQASLATKLQGIVRLTWNDETIFQTCRPSVRFDGIAVPLAPGGFLQATVQGETALRAAVTEALGGATQIADLFAGSGTFALPLARQARVHAVEREASALHALEDGWRHAKGLKTITTEPRDLFRRPLLPDELSQFDGLVIDPPRAGAAAQIEQIAKLKIPCIAMVSCNPQSFARDTAALHHAGYRLQWIEIVDQFRWSPHVELAALLRPAHMAR